MDHAPIVLFVYNRPEHTRRTLESLLLNVLAGESTLLVFADGPKANADEHEINKIEEVRRIVVERQWCNEVKLYRSDCNKGLAQSLQSGITEVLDEYDKAIVLEDDLEISPYFLNYMNAGLNRFNSIERVMQISGHMFDVSVESPFDAFFLPFITSWGWATWKRAWKKCDHTMSRFEELSKDRVLKSRFNLDDSYNYFDMLVNQMNRKIDSWAIIWYLSVFFHDGLTLYPARTLVRNCGFDGSGTHFKKKTDTTQSQSISENSSWVLPQEIAVDHEAFSAIKEYLANSGKNKGKSSIAEKVSKFIKF